VALSWVRAIGARLDVRTVIGSGTTMTLHIPSSQDDVVTDAGAVAWQTDEVAEEELVR